MDSRTLFRLLKRYDVQRAANAIKTLQFLFPDCLVRLCRGYGEIEVICPTEDRMYEVWGGQPFYGHWLPVERFSLKTKNGEAMLTVPVEQISFDTHRFFPKGAASMNSNYTSSASALPTLNDSSTLKLIERVMGESRPMSIISLTSHQNLIFNSALIQMANKPASELRKRNLRLSWFRKNEFNPELLAIENYLPPQLDSMIQALRQQTMLNDWRYEGWNGAVYGSWCSKIEFVEFQGEPCRTITTLGFDAHV